MNTQTQYLHMYTGSNDDHKPLFCVPGTGLNSSYILTYIVHNNINIYVHAYYMHADLPTIELL